MYTTRFAVGSVTHLSIIIPATGSQELLDETLVSVLENQPDDCEVLLVHSGEYSDPYDLGDEVRFVQGDADDRLQLWNTGIEHCRGSVVHLLRPGVTVAAGWCDSALQLFEADRNIGAVSPCIVANGNRRTVQGINYDAVRGKRIVRSSRQAIVAPLIGSGFYQTTAIRFMRGFDCRFGEYADVELGMRMRSASYKAKRCDSRIFSEERVAVSPVRGYLGGRQRGELYRAASRLGIATSMAGILGLLSEPYNNGFGPSSFSAILGRLNRFESREAEADIRPIADSDGLRGVGKRRVG